MKFLVLLLASTALALVKPRGPGLASDIGDIAKSVTTLQTQVDGFQGANQADDLIAAAEAVSTAIKKGIDDANASPILTQEEAFALVQPLSDLIDAVDQTVKTLIAKKQLFADSGRGCEVYPQLVAQLAYCNTFSDALVSKSPVTLRDIAHKISDTIVEILSRGVAAFKDVQCAATSIITTQSSTASIPSATTSSASQATTTASSESPTTTSTGGSSGSSASASSPVSTSATASGPWSASQSGTSSTSGTAPSSGSWTGTKTSGAGAGSTGTDSATHTGSPTATATGSEPCDESTTVQVPVTETVPCTTTGGSGSQPTTSGSGSQPTGGSASQPSTSGSGSQPTGGSGCPGCAPGETSPGSGSGPNHTTLVPVPSGGEGGNGGNRGTGGNASSPSPSSPIIAAGARRAEIPLAVAIAAVAGAVGAAF